MKKYNYILLLFLSILYCEKQIYSTVQMMDQVQIINIDNMQIEQSVSTEFSNNSSNNTCSDLDTEMDCTMNTGCEWMMGMCMEESQNECDDYNSEMECSMNSGCMWMEDHCMNSSDSCMTIETEMECTMSAGCEWMMGMCMESMSSDNINTPHFIALDEINGYWFVTTIASGFVAQYSLIDNSLIDSYFVGDAPALIVADPVTKKVYCSRMMPMNGMGNMMPESQSTVIQSLHYSAMGLSEGVAYEINSPAPHGLAINEDGTEIYTASNTADWIYKINTNTGEITGSVMDFNVNNTPDQTTQRLKPIQCLSVGDKLFVSCSAGPWMDPWTGNQSIIPGKLQMWNSDSMELIDTFDFENYSSPWHIKNSPIDEIIYVSLSGDNLYDTEGVASIRFNNDEMSLEWITHNDNFEILHGIDVSSDGQNILVSGRGDGNIHKLNYLGDYIDNTFLGSMSMLGGLAIEQKGVPILGDLNNDHNVNVSDAILGINIIFYPMMSNPYPEYACDVNQDGIINIVDIVLIVGLILGS